MWLPSGWLAIVLMLTATATAPAAEWRARGSAAGDTATSVRKATAAKSTFGVAPLASHQRPTPAGRRAFVGRGPSAAPATAIRRVQFEQVGYEDDIAGPALRVASRPAAPTRSRLAQQEADALENAFERPFGAAEKDPAVNDALENALERPFGVRDAEPIPEPRDDMPTDASDGLFDDLPDDPFEETDEATEPAGRYADDPVKDLVEEVEKAPAPPRFDRGFDAPIPPRDTGRDRRGASDGLAKERAAAAEDCAENLAEVKAATIDQIDLSLAISGVEGEDYPFSCSIDDGTPFQTRCWSEVTYMWKASALCHKPLFFEDTQLERYGHSWGPYTQPFISGAHFFSRIFVLPYNMGLTAPNECIYTLGHYRPGDCAPYMIEPIPFTWRAAAFQAGATVGAAAILP